MANNAEVYEAIIIGTGQAGVPLAKFLAEKGLKTAIVEKSFVGGSCVNWGCTPTKKLVTSAQVAHYVKNARKWGVEAGDFNTDFKKVMQLKQELVEHSREANTEGIEETENLSLLRGHARFADKHHIELTDENTKKTRLIKGDNIYINVGTSPALPNIDGLESVPYLTNRGILQLSQLPEHLLIIGGGYIGLEFGQIFRRFGSKVTIIDTHHRLIHTEDKDVSVVVEGFLKEEGVKLKLNAKPIKLREENQKILLDVETEKGIEQLKGSHLLVATGRTPNTKELGLEKVAVKRDDKGYIEVDKYLQTATPNIYALGDCKGGPAFTHIAYDDFRVVSRNYNKAKKVRSTHDRTVSFTMFTDPQYTRVGSSEAELIEEGKDYKKAFMKMERAARATERGETDGFFKILIDKQTDKLLGGQVIGYEAGEIGALILTAITAKMTWQQLRDVPFAHPTLSESINKMLNEVEDES